MTQRKTEQEIAMRDRQNVGWVGIRAIIQEMETIEHERATRTAAVYGDDGSVSSDVVFNGPDGSSKTYRISVTLSAPYGEGSGFCAKCNVSTDSDNYGGALAELAVHTGLCFTCAIWYERVQRGFQRRNGIHVLITSDFDYYTVNPYVSTLDRRESLGHGGRTFEISFTGGEVIFSNDVWHGGTIPPLWRPELQPNGSKKSVIGKWNG